MSRQKAPLALRLATGSVLITGSVFVATFSLVYFSLASSAHTRVDDRLRHEAAELATTVAESVPSNLQSEISNLANAEGTGTFHYRVVSRTGERVAESDTALWPGLRLDLDTVSSIRDEPIFRTVQIAASEGPVRVIYVMSAPDKVLQVAMRQENEQQALRDLRRILAILGGVGLLASCVMGWIAAERLLSPLDRMTKTVQNIAAGNFGDRVTGAFDDAELDRLARAFNVMLDQIQAFVRELREMNDSIAHDIRTVVARISLATGRLLSTRPLSEEQESLAVAVSENATELLGMLDTIMDLSEMNTGVAVVPRHDVNISKLLADLVELFGVAAQEKCVELDLSCRSDIVVAGDFNRLRRAFANLVDNAVKYTEAGGRINIRAEQEATRVIVTVADTGIGISPDELPLIFNRFYRADKSRAGIGHGLGLSLAAAIVRLHGGTITVESELGKGAAFRIAL